MRKILLAVAILASCSKGDAPPADSAAADSPAAAAAPAAPARLTAADVNGTWTGVTKAEGTDSVLARWTSRVTDSTAVQVTEGRADSLRYRVTYDADSIVLVSEPYSAAPNGPKVIARVVGRLENGRGVGAVTAALAAKPDSVILRGRYEATRTP